MTKRIMDCTVSAMMLILLSPLLLGVAIAVRLTMGRPVLFFQERLGLDGKPFKLLKFRTMTDLRDECGEPLDDSLRQTRLGNFLRKTSIDELPQLLNVLRGEMSLVGPRPLLTEYGPLLSVRQNTRQRVRPGITGLAQVRGRQQLSWSVKLALDVEYAQTRSLWLDIAILFKTLGVIVSPDGTYEGDSADQDDLDIWRVLTHQYAFNRGRQNGRIQYSIQPAPRNAVVRFFKEIDRQYDPPMSRLVDLDEFAAKIATRGECVSAWNEAGLVGFAAIYVDDPQNCNGFLTEISVLRPYSGHGIGTTLLTMACRIAREAGKRAVILETAEDNWIAQSFFLKFGFECYAVNHFGWCMRYCLTPQTTPRVKSAETSTRVGPSQWATVVAQEG